MDNWKILYVGIGSIAKRHIINTTELLRKQNEGVSIDVFRSGNGGPISEDITELINRIYSDYTAVPQNYDAVFITNPTEFHLDTLKKFHRNGRHFFIEKPLCSLKQLDRFTMDFLRNDCVYYVACPLRYTNVIQYIKDNVNIQRVRSIRSICSSYLPDWRPGVDYKNTYSAKKALGGGVSIDLVHEWDYLCYLLGRPSKVYNIIKKVSDLEIDSDDIAVYIAEYPDKIVELHLDYFGRFPTRKIDLFMENDSIVCDLINHKITFEREGRTISFEEDRDFCQTEELAHFFNLIKTKKYGLMEIEKAKTVLAIAGGMTR